MMCLVLSVVPMQTWMPLVPVMTCASYGFISLWPVESMPAYHDSVRSGVDVIFTLVMQAPFEQVCAVESTHAGSYCAGIVWERRFIAFR